MLQLWPRCLPVLGPRSPGGETGASCWQLSGFSRAQKGGSRISQPGWFLITSEFTVCGQVLESVVGVPGLLTIAVPRMTEWETAAPAVAETPDIKLFGKWSTDDVQINDISLQVRRDVVVVLLTWGWGHLKLVAVLLSQELKT